MSRNGIIGVLAVCLALGLAGAGVLGWIYFSRDKGVAVLNYAVVPGESFQMGEVIRKERELLVSEEVLKPVIKELNLQNRWNLASEEEALKHLRGKITVKPGREADRIVIVYRDQSQERAMDIMGAMQLKYLALRRERVESGEMPPLAKEVVEGGKEVPLAVLNYRVIPGDQFEMGAVTAKERELFLSDAALRPVVTHLDLVTAWNASSEAEVLTRLRENLSVSADQQDGSRIVVVYRDETQERALEILGAIRGEFLRLRMPKEEGGEMPPLMRVGDAGGSAPEPTP